MEISGRLFQELVVQYFHSRGYAIEWLNQVAGVLELREQDLNRGTGRAVRVALLNRTTQQKNTLRQIPMDLDFLIRNDSPFLAEKRPATEEIEDAINRRLGHLPLYDFGRDILFRQVGNWVRDEADAIAGDLVPEAHLLTDTDLPSNQSEPSSNWLHNDGHAHDLVELTSCRALITGNRRADISRLLEHHRRDILLELKKGYPERAQPDLADHHARVDRNAASISPIVLPVKLSAYRIRTRGFLDALRENLPPGTIDSLSDEVLRLCLQLRYLMVFVDRIEDWSIDYDLDPNRGSFLDVFGNLGKTGAFAFGCDKTLVFHVVCTDLLQKPDIRPYTKTLGTRFLQDPKLDLVMLKETWEEVITGKDNGRKGDDVGAPIQPKALDEFLDKTRGLLGEEEWRLLIRNLALRLFSTDSPGYLDLDLVRLEIEDVLPDARTLKSNTDHVSRNITESGIFEVAPVLGVRFKDPDEAEEIVAEGLRLAMEDLYFLGETHSENGKYPGSDPYLQKFAQFMTLPQMNERIIYRAMRKFGIDDTGYERCKQLWGANLMGIFSADSWPENSGEIDASALRGSLLRMANVLQAWIQRSTKAQNSGAWTLFESSPQLPRIELRQIHLHGLDLRGANFSVSSLPFASFENCNLDDADFRYSYAISAYFKDCSMERTKFEKADLSGSIIETASGLDPLDFSGAALWATKFSGARGETPLDVSSISGGSGGSSCRFIGKQSLSDGTVSLPEDPEYLEGLLATTRRNRNEAVQDLWRFPPFRLKYNKEKGSLEIGNFDANVPGTTLEDIAAFDAVPINDGNTLLVAIVLRSGEVQLLHVGKAAPFSEPERHSVLKMRQQDTSFTGAAIRLMEDRKGLVACWFPEEMAFAQFEQTLNTLSQAAPSVHSISLRDIEEKLDLLLPALIGRERVFILAGEKGGLHVFTHKDSEIEQSGSTRGNSRPICLAFIPHHGQVLAAREDGSLDIYHLGAGEGLIKHASFLLAHERIHTIITDSTGDKYLVMGLSEAPEGTTEHSAESEEPLPADFNTLVALCNASFEVLAVWPVDPYSERGLAEEMCKLSKTPRTYQAADSGMLQDAAHLRGLMRKLLNSFACTECKVDSRSGQSILKYTVTYDTELACQLGEEGPLSIRDAKEGAERNYLSYRFSVRHSPTDTSRPVPMSEVFHQNTKKGILGFTFSHPFFLKTKRRFEPHEVDVTFMYDTETSRRMESRPVRLDRIDPFHASTEVSGEGSFFGFEEEINDWAAKLMKSGGALTITGARRMGKSSFGAQLARTLASEKNVIVVRMNIERHHSSQQELFKSITDALQTALKEKHLEGIDFSPIDQAYKSSPSTFQEEIFNFLRLHHINNPILVLMFDEVGQIYDVGVKTESASEGSSPFSPDAFANGVNFFRTLVELYEKDTQAKFYLRFVLIGLPWHFWLPVNLSWDSGITRYFYAPGQIHHVGPFTDELIEEIVSQKLKSQEMTIEDSAISYCRELSSNVAHDAQMIMKLAFAEWHNRYRRNPEVKPEIRLDDIKGVAEQELAEFYKQYRDAIWPSLGEEARQWIAGEVMKDQPRWEMEPIRFEGHDELRKFREMGYWRQMRRSSVDSKRTGGPVLFIPRGLTLSFRNLLGQAG